VQIAGTAGFPASPRPARATLTALSFAVVLSMLSSLFVVAGGVWIRLLLALTIALFLVTVTLTRPSLGITATFIYLVFLALIRRVLIGAAPWVSADPLLLVGPLVAVVLLVKAFVLDSRPAAPDAVSKLVALVLAITFVEVVNPASGGISAGIAGLMFMAVPLLWFFVGRNYLGDLDIDRLMTLVVVLGTLVACYGLWQTQVGDPPWDTNWLNVTGGYSALNVGDTIRAFGTFSSSAEYALFIGTALAVAVSFCLRGHLLAALPIPLLAVALFLSSGRGPLVTAAFAIVVILGLSTGRPVTALAVAVFAVGAAFLALHFGGSALSSSSSSSGALVSHQISGLTNPLDPNSSTLLIHVQKVVDGFKTSLHHPFGEGTAVTNNAAGVSQTASNTANNNGAATSTGGSTEVDISNAFVGLGIVGGILYTALVALVLIRAVVDYFRGRTVLLPIIALLVVGAGEWLTGGNYALASLIWLLIGAAAAHRPASRRAAASTGS